MDKSNKKCSEKTKEYLKQKEEEKKEKLQKERAKKRKNQSTCQFCYRMFLNKNACDRHVKKIHNENKDADEASYLKKMWKALIRNAHIVKDVSSTNFPGKIM